MSEGLWSMKLDRTRIDEETVAWLKSSFMRHQYTLGLNVMLRVHVKEC